MERYLRGSTAKIFLLSPCRYVALCSSLLSALPFPFFTRPRPPERMAGVLEIGVGPIVPNSPSELERVALSMGCPAPFVDWLSEQGLTLPEELAMVCAKETEIEVSLLTASGVAFTRLIDRVSVTKLWLHARSRVDKSVALQSGRITEALEEKHASPFSRK